MNSQQREMLMKIKDRGNMEKFAVVLIKKFQQNLRDLKVGDTGRLTSGFKHRIHRGSDGLVHKISFSHPNYGTFVDMGVGNGVSLEDIGMQTIGKNLLGRKVQNRRAKRWYLKMIYSQTVRLASYVQNTRGNYYTAIFHQTLQELPDVNIRI